MDKLCIQRKTEISSFIVPWICGYGCKTPIEAKQYIKNRNYNCNTSNIYTNQLFINKLYNQNNINSKLSQLIGETVYNPTYNLINTYHIPINENMNLIARPNGVTLNNECIIIVDSYLPKFYRHDTEEELRIKLLTAMAVWKAKKGIYIIIKMKKRIYINFNDAKWEDILTKIKLWANNNLLIIIKNLIDNYKISINQDKQSIIFYEDKYNKLFNKTTNIENKSNKSNDIYKICESYKMCLDIETDRCRNILQIAYNMYNINNDLIYSKDFYVYDGIHSEPFYPTINKSDIINYGISLKDASNIITSDLNNTNIIIGHNIKAFDLKCIKKLNNIFNNQIKDTLIIHDTMIGAKHIINAKNELEKLKNPRLEEMVQFFFNKPVDNYHNAYGDITATFECYKILCEKYNCFL